MVDRDDWGSWLGGDPTGEATATAGEHRGARLGLPAAGPGSLAGSLRRVGALAVDWAASMLVAYLVWHTVDGFGPLLVFAVENLLLLATVGGTLGHQLLGMRVARLGPAAARPGIGPRAALVRTLLLCLVIPAVVWDADGRGMHDRLAGTVIVRR